MRPPAYQRFAYYACLILSGLALSTFARYVSGHETAEALSRPGALQAYVDGTLKAASVCRLPRGRIVGNLRITKRNGGRIIGAGMPYAPSDSSTGWNQKTKHFATTIVSPNREPAITWEPTIGFTIERLGVEAKNIGIHYVADAGWGGTMNRLTQVSFLGCDVGFQAGTNENDGNCADVVFDQCFFNRCQVGFESVNHQAVNFRFTGCNWQRCKLTDIRCDRGGLVNVSGCYTFGTNIFLSIHYGGRGAMPCTINGLALDRQPSRDPAPILVYARNAKTNVLVDARGIKITGERREETDRQLYYLPLYDHPAYKVIVGSISTPVRYQEGK